MFVPLMMVRTISPEQVGLFKIFFLYVLMSPALSMTSGLLSGLGYWAGQGERGQKAIQISNTLTVGAGIALASIALIFSRWTTAWLDWPHVYSIFFAFSILGTVALTFLEESSIVTGKIWFGAIYTSGTEIFRSLLIVTAALIFKDLEMILLFSTIASVGKVILGVWLARRRNLIGLQIDWEIARDILKYAMPVSFAWMVGIFANSADQVVLSHVMDPADFAVYAIGCLAVPPLMIIEQSVTRIMIPQLSSAFSNGQPSRAAHSYRDAVNQLAWLLIPAVTGLVIFANPIIHMLFTERYASATSYLQWFALSYLALIFPYDAVPRARGEGRWILKNFTLFAAVPIILCYTLGMKFGAFGALAGLLISRFVMRVYALVYIRASTQWKFHEFIPFWNMAVYAIVSLILGLGCLALRAPLGGGLTWFLVGGACFVILYFPIALGITNYKRRLELMRSADEGHVLLFSQHLGVGGLERLVLSLGQELKKTGRWDVFVFSHDSEENAKFYTEKSLVGDFLQAQIPVDALQKGSGICFKTIFRLVKNIYKNNIDVVHSHDMGTLVYAVIAKFLSIGRVRIVHTQHSFVHINRFKRYELYEKIFSAFVDELTVVNENLISSYEKLGVPTKKIHTVHNGVCFLSQPMSDRSEKISRRKTLLAGLSTNQSLPNSAEESYWILYLARLHSVKGQREAAKIWENLSPELRKKSQLWIVGPEAEKDEKNHVLSAFASVSDRDHVHFLDGTKVPHEWIAVSDVYLSCSKFEGMPLGPLEAIGSGLPAVLSAIPGHEFLNASSLQYPLGDGVAGAAQIEKILGEKNLGSSSYYQDLWKRSDWIRQKFSLEAMAEQYSQLYRGIRK